MNTLALLCLALPAAVIGQNWQNEGTFDKAAYLGTWYECNRTLGMAFQTDSDTDVTATYTENEDGTIRVVNRGWLPEQSTWNTATGTARQVGPFRLTVQFGRGPPGDYQIVYTDYSRYALVYSEPEFRGTRSYYAWVLCRNPEDYSAEDQNNAIQTLINKSQGNLNRDSFRASRHGVAPTGPPDAADNENSMTFDNVNRYGDNTVDKCSYRVPQFTCNKRIGDIIVYDAATCRCGWQSNGCSIGEVAPYAFNSIADCYRSCHLRMNRCPPRRPDWLWGL